MKADSSHSTDPMLDLVRALPRQMESAMEEVAAASVPEELSRRRVLLCGMGGSAAAGELARGLLFSEPVQFEVNRGYRLPGWVDDDTLLIFSSYSGGTEEVLSCWDHAREQAPSAPRVVISSGGALGERAQQDGVLLLSLPGGLPPRASLGHGAGTLFSLLGRLGLLPGAEEGMREAVEVMDRLNESFGEDEHPTQNQVRRLARRLYGKLPLIYAGGSMTAAVARRWQAQINENAKALAFHSVLPELDHNEIVGWEVPTRARAETFVVALRDRGDHPRVQRRFELTRAILGAKVPGWENVESEGSSLIARTMSLVLFGDYLSVFLAEAGGVEATPVVSIQLLKEKLADPQS